MSICKLSTIISLLLLLAALLFPISSPLRDHGSEIKPFASLSVLEAHGQVSDTKFFVIVVSSNGFNGTDSFDLAITVNEGDRVQITFMMDEKDRKNVNLINRHIIEITGYAIQTEEISPSNPEATLVFLADKIGDFTIRCSSETWDCPGHRLMQDGRLTVKAKEASSPPEEKIPDAFVPFVEDSDVVIDGEVGDDEYSSTFQDSITKMTVYWEHNGTHLYVSVVSQGAGWISIGFGYQEGGMDGANIIIGYVDDKTGDTILSDSVGVEWKHYPDTDRGGQDNIISKAGSQQNGTTVIEFVFPLDSGDANDHKFEVGRTYGFILAYHPDADNLLEYHASRSDSLSVYIGIEGEAPPENRVEQPDEKLLKTNLELYVFTLCPPDCPVTLMVTLTDVERRPLVGMPVAFYFNTTFGTFKIGSSYTDSRGIASLNYSIMMRNTLEGTASFPGGGGYEASTAHIIKQLPTVTAESTFPAPTAKNVASGLAVIAILSVWGTYLFVIRQIRDISREERDFGASSSDRSLDG